MLAWILVGAGLFVGAVITAVATGSVETARMFVLRFFEKRWRKQDAAEAGRLERERQKSEDDRSRVMAADMHAHAEEIARKEHRSTESVERELRQWARLKWGLSTGDMHPGLDPEEPPPFDDSEA